MKTIYKYKIKVQDRINIEMPKGAKILTVQPQGNNVCLWALVNKEESEVENRYFHIYGTGHEIMVSYLEYIGTFQFNGGGFVGHIFEDIKTF